MRIDTPASYPQPDEIDVAREPIVKASIITPAEYVGGLMDLSLIHIFMTVAKARKEIVGGGYYVAHG